MTAPSKMVMAAPSTVNCEHCGATMEWVKGPAPNVRVNTYTTTCRRMDLPATRGAPSTIYPNRCGETCFRNIPTDG